VEELSGEEEVRNSRQLFGDIIGSAERHPQPPPTPRQHKPEQVSEISTSYHEGRGEW